MLRKWIIAGLIFAVCAVAAVYSMPFWLTYDCGITEETLQERRLANGDWIKIRQEPDCSWTGGPRVHLYIKHSEASDYRKLTFWNGTTADNLQVHLNALTPLILHSNASHIYLRSDESGWHDMSVTHLVNELLPGDYPIFDEGSVAHESFDENTNILIVRGVTANSSQRIYVKIGANSDFEFAGFVEQPPSLNAQLQNPIALPVSFPWSAELTGLAEGEFTFELDLNTVAADNNTEMQSKRLVKLPAKCATTYAATCERTRVVIVTAAERPRDLRAEMPILLSIAWLVEPRLYETDSYLLRDGQLQAVDLPSLQSKLASPQHPVWSVHPIGIPLNDNREQLMVSFFVSPLGNNRNPPYVQLGEVSRSQQLVDEICTNYIVTVAVNANSPVNAPVIGEIVNIEYKSIHANTMCRDRELPKL